MGFYLGKAKFTEGKKTKWVLISLLLPFILHGSYDYILISQENWLYIILPFMIFLWWFGLRKVKMARILTTNHKKKQYSAQNSFHS
jgi:RsiW-degrading membrane proteinase PrsW (M82 family)